MPLIKSISGIRGTIGGRPDEGLTPLDVVRFTSAFAAMMKARAGSERLKVVVGRDARISGEMVRQLVCATLQGMGADVIDLGLSTTPTVELAVPGEHAHAGIILTASHNPREWNALKLLNARGEFISAAEGSEVLEIAAQENFNFAEIDKLGTYREETSWLQRHIDAVCGLELVDIDAIKKAGFTIAVDAVNSSGGIFVPALLRALGVQEVHELYCDPTGEFPHNPEPLPEHLADLSALILEKKADLGITVDPDVDRLAMVCEDGSMFGEEYTLVAVADHVLRHKTGHTVSNLSSTRALRDVTLQHGGTHSASAVGEVNVVEEMKAMNAVIGGEGNGGVIYPDSHYGRDALVGVALFLTRLAQSGMKASELKASFPQYFMSKNKVQLEPGMDVDRILEDVAERYADESVDRTDGVKIDFESEWVHLRKSNTEPIIRIYAESTSEQRVEALARRMMNELKEIAH